MIQLTANQKSKLDIAFLTTNPRCLTTIFDEVIDACLLSCFSLLFRPYSVQDPDSAFTYTPPRITLSSRVSFLHNPLMIPVKKHVADSGKALFIKTLQDPKSFLEFKGVAETELCMENIKFYEDYMQLEKGHVC